MFSKSGRVIGMISPAIAAALVFALQLSGIGI
jgi:hypothetical protein